MIQTRIIHQNAASNIRAGDPSLEHRTVIDKLSDLKKILSIDQLSIISKLSIIHRLPIDYLQTILMEV